MIAIPETYLRGARVTRLLPVVPWAMLRLRNERSRAFRGRYSPENAPWGVEIAEAQYWPHVRTVDVIGPPQAGKTFHVCELTTLYDLCEARETVFYLNGSEDNAKNLWRTRWLPTVQADPVLIQQLKERMDGGEWYERHLRDGGLLYSAGPQSASALSQRESRIVRCSELEKTPSAIRNEASSYALARDRAAAYPSTHMITSDCTITVREGLSWKRFVQGDRSRPFIPCPACGHYACPVHQRHIDEEAFGFNEENTHLFDIPELALASPDLAKEAARLLCRKCGHSITDRDFRQAVRAVVWLPFGCQIIRADDPAATPIPAASWLDSLNRWAAEQLSDCRVVGGEKDPEAPPAWEGPRLPDGVSLSWSPSVPAGEGDAEKLPAFRADPRQSSARSFWFWRLFAPKYSIGEVAREIVAGDIGAATGDVMDDQKNTSQKCFVLPWVEPLAGMIDELNEDAVLACVTDHPTGIIPERCIGIAAGIDINEAAIHWSLKAATEFGEVYTIDHGHEQTDFAEMRKERDMKWNPDDPVFQRLRRDVVYSALDRIFDRYASGVPDAEGELFPVGMTYIDAGYMSEEIYLYCARYHFSRMRPCKGRGSAVRFGRRSGNLAGLWTDGCEKRAVSCRDMRNQPLRHQYFDPADPRRLMFLDADFWKREVHNGILTTSRALTNSRQPGQPPMKAYWFLHAGLTPKNVIPGQKLRKLDRFITQVIAERWGERENPRTKRVEKGWQVIQEANHHLDAEAYATAALAALGALPRYVGKPEIATAIATAIVKAVGAGGTSPAPERPAVRAPVSQPGAGRMIRRTY
jgi:phage terminase large subunit GpA-like protein